MTKKTKFSDMGNNKENAFYNSYNTLEDSLFLEYPHNNNPLSWDKKVEFELSALKDTINIWNNFFTEYSGEDNETLQKPPTTIIEPESMLDMSTQVEQTTERETAQNPIEKKTQDTNSLQREEEQTQVTMECSNEEEYQMTMGSSPDTNDTEVKMINPTENDLVIPELQMSEILDTKDKLVAQHDNSGESTTPIYMQGNEDLRDELNTLSFTNNSAARSSEHVEPYTLETANKATQPGDTEWLHSEGFTPVVNKKLAASKKNKKN
ncbi:5286_t:CDS:2 [Gigaspora margarita]|uniref:5286_t:CDS:1 n=1 Tax=Gigaspora margarita TaxID=4874 RepID=A0ABN7UEJ4_GIGMA|nr:5286_t:CDS:2 [Gigaspora margarita]